MTHFLRLSRQSLTFALMIFFSALSWGQKDAGTIVGTVKDQSGAVVSDAKVTVTDADRGTSLQTKTNMTGEYIAGPLHIGSYNITVEKQGFKKAVVGPIVLDVQARPAVDVTLQVGQVA